jgi:pantoate kinase
MERRMTTPTTTPTPTAFSPGSVTCFFVPSVGASLTDTSSAGCGICISDGVTAAVRPAATVAIRFNGRPIDFPPVRSVIDDLAPEPVEVFLETPIPLGCGFGISAASSLTTAFALARRFSLEKSRWELGEVVLRAEIRHRTGIGDPVTQLMGGVVLRRWRSGPFDAQSISLVENDKATGRKDDKVTEDNPVTLSPCHPVTLSPLYYRVFGPLSTKEVLSNPSLVRRLAEEGKTSVSWLEQNQRAVTLEQLLDRTLDFAQKSGLVTDARVIQAIDEVQRNHGRAMMVMLGQSVLASRPPADATDWRDCRIDPEGTRYIG